MVFQEFLPTLGAAFRSCFFAAAQPFYALVAQSCVERAGRCEVVAQGDRQDLPYVADYKAYIKEFMDQSRPDEVLFVTGSLYFIAEVRAFLLEG